MVPIGNLLDARNATARFQRIAEAYQELKDQERRAIGFVLVQSSWQMMAAGMVPRFGMKTALISTLLWFHVISC